MVKKPKNFFFSADDLPIFDLNQIYMVSSTWYDTGMFDVWGTFDVLVRDMPPHRNFMIAAGLEEMIENIKSWHYTDENIRFLIKEKLISRGFSRYLKKFRFSGSIEALPEGTIFFPQEPIIRITTSIIEANLFTAFLINIISSNVPIVTKFVRCVIAAGNKGVIGLAPQRCLSFESTLKGQRCSYIAGSNDQPGPAARKRLGLEKGDHATIGYHAFITSYSTESEAMYALAETCNVDFSLMVDTYDVKQGVKNAIEVAKKLKSKGKKLRAIVIDSGDLLRLSRMCRKMLDRAGLKDVGITLASNLDEYHIAKLTESNTPADKFIVSTEAAVVSDAPGMEVVYKMSEIIDNWGVHPKMKFSHNKMSLPGRKQVYRVIKGGKFHHDIIGLEGENLGHPQLVPIYNKGKLVYKIPSLSNIRNRVKQQLAKLPRRYLSINKEHTYPVKLSGKLNDLIKKLRKVHKIKT